MGLLESTWKSMQVTDSNGLVRMKKKLQLLKSAIKVWIKETKARSYEKKTTFFKIFRKSKNLLIEVWAMKKLFLNEPIS